MTPDELLEEEISERRFNDRCEAADIKEEIRRMAMIDQERANETQHIKVIVDRLFAGIDRKIATLDQRDIDGHIWYSHMKDFISLELTGKVYHE